MKNLNETEGREPVTFPHRNDAREALHAPSVPSVGLTVIVCTSEEDVVLLGKMTELLKLLKDCKLYIYTETTRQFDLLDYCSSRLHSDHERTYLPLFC